MNIINLKRQSEMFRVQIGDRTISVFTYYMRINDTWKISLHEGDVTLVEGVGLLNGIDILEPYNIGLGAMRMVDVRSTRQDANSQTLGTGVLLIHMTNEEHTELVETQELDHFGYLNPLAT